MRHLGEGGGTRIVSALLFSSSVAKLSSFRKLKGKKTNCEPARQAEEGEEKKRGEREKKEERKWKAMMANWA